MENEKKRSFNTKNNPDEIALIDIEDNTCLTGSSNESFKDVIKWCDE
jgi:hypothetical protein